MTINGMITVRTQSTRLPNKCLLQFQDHKTVLEHVIERCLWFDIDPIVATTTDLSDDIICEIAQRLGVRYSRGPIDDKMLRWLQATKQFSVKSFVAVDCDDPFFDPILTQAIHQKLINTNSDYMLPDMSAYIGSHNIAVLTRALETSVESKESTLTEMIEQFLHKNAKINKFIINDRRAIEQFIRLTLDYNEDWYLITTVYRELGSHAKRSEIIKFFEKYTGLTLINSFRHADWLKHRTCQS